MRTLSFSMNRLILILVSFAVIVTLSLTYGSLATWRYCKHQGRIAAESVQKYEALQKELVQIRKSYSDFMNILGVEIVELGGKGGPEMPELTDVSAVELSLASEMADDAAMDPLFVLMEAASLKSGFDDLVRLADAKIAEFAATPSVWPIKIGPETQIWISSKFGTRRNPFTRAWERHEGIDISSRCGTPLIATADGTIVKMEKDRYLGNFVEIRHSEKFSTIYGHMKGFAEGIKKGTKIKRFQIIGYMGRTGKATGCHVHYEVRVNGERKNPRDYILN